MILGKRILILHLIFVIYAKTNEINKHNLDNIDSLYDDYINKYPDIEKYASKDNFRMNLIEIN